MRYRLTLLLFVLNTLLSVIINLERYTGTSYGRTILILLGWLIAGFVPLVSFDAGGGQTAPDIIRYIVFRGVDRDTWYAVSPWALLGGMLSASAILAGMICLSIGLGFRDGAYILWGGCTTAIGLVVVILCASPIASTSFLGLALPHVGWWLLIVYLGFLLVMASIIGTVEINDVDAASAQSIPAEGDRDRIV